MSLPALNPKKIRPQTTACVRDTVGCTSPHRPAGTRECLCSSSLSSTQSCRRSSDSNLQSWTHKIPESQDHKTHLDQSPGPDCSNTCGITVSVLGSVCSICRTAVLKIYVVFYTFISLQHFLCFYAFFYVYLLRLHFFNLISIF